MTLYNGCRDYLFIQKVKNTPTSKVSSTAVGLVELAGKAASDTPLRTPVSRNRCVYWRVTGEYFETGKHGGWRKIYMDESASHFHIRDITGEIDVDPRGAEIDIAEDRSWDGFIKQERGFFFTSSGGSMLPNPAMQFVNSFRNRDTDKFWKHGDEKIRIREYFIAENDLLYIIGSAEPCDGMTGPVNHETLVIRKGKRDGTMFIADKTEKEVSDKRISWAYPKIFLGLGCSAICLFGILMMLETARDALFLVGITALVLSLAVLWDRWEGHL